MTVKIIAENQIEAAGFVSATEQASPFWPTPDPDAANTGAFRLLSSGTPADFVYSGTATSNGAAGGTTTIDAILAAFGDDFFIGATLLMTGGTCNGESKTITDFAQATGTLTHAAFTAQIDSGDTFTLTIPYSSRDFHVVEVASGDTGTGTFKWSHNGGTTFLGRDNPNQANWLALATIDNNARVAGKYAKIIQAANGNLVAFYVDEATANTKCKISSNGGITWGAAIAVSTSANFYTAITLASGKIIVYDSSGYLSYSNDNGATWTVGAICDAKIKAVVEMSPNVLYVVIEDSGVIYAEISRDGGNSYASLITIANDANTQQQPSICMAKDGTLICAYASDQDALNDFEIVCKRSTDGGVTWGAIAYVLPIAGGGADMSTPSIITDADGVTLYCVATKANADQTIVLATSTDKGATWGAETQLATTGGKDLVCPRLALVDGHEVLCTFLNLTDLDFQFVRRGMWEAFSANACPCAVGNTKQGLVCGASVTWQGGAGIAADLWTFGADYLYRMANLVSDSPSQPWRSTQDGIACEIVINMGATARYYADAVAFFGCNIRTLNFQMNATDAWGAPSVDQAVSFDLATGAVDNVPANVNHIQDTSLLANYKDHELRGCRFRMTSGARAGDTWDILDNVDDFIVVDGATTMVVQGDTFAVFQDHIAVTFAEGVYRYMRISIPAQETADNFYQIGAMVAGRATQLTSAWAAGFNKPRKYNLDMLQTPSGGLIPIRGAAPRYQWDLTIPMNAVTNRELVSIADLLMGRNLVLIPDSSVLTDCHLCKFNGEIEQGHVFMDKYRTGFSLVEVK